MVAAVVAVGGGEGTAGPTEPETTASGKLPRGVGGRPVRDAQRSGSARALRGGSKPRGSGGKRAGDEPAGEP